MAGKRKKAAGYYPTAFLRIESEGLLLLAEDLEHLGATLATHARCSNHTILHDHFLLILHGHLLLTFHASAF